MSLLTGSKDFFALDIGTSAIRAVKLNHGSNMQLAKYGIVNVDAQTSQSESKNDQARLGEAIKQVIANTGINTKNVVVGIPSTRVFTTVVDFPKMNLKELDKTIQYQADQFIPTKLEDSKMDYAVIGDSPVDSTKYEILIASVTKKYSEERLDLLESIGLNVIAMEPDAFALARALVKPEAMEATMVLDIGATATDLVVMYQNNPRLVRSIPIGGDTLLKATMQNLSIDEKQANQFIYKFGLMKDKLEGQVFKAIQPSVESLISDVTKSVNFFTSRYKQVPITKIIVSGRGSILPDFPVYLVNKTNITVEIGNAWLNVSYPQTVYNDLMSVSAQYPVAVGLAERKQ